MLPNETETFFDADARARILKGAERLYNAVKVTLGPLGRNVVIERNRWVGAHITHDGVTVAKAIRIPQFPADESRRGEHVGADLIKKAASKTNDNVGDGTTTSTVLAYHILEEASRMMAAGNNPMNLKKGLDAAAATVLAGLPALSETVSGDKTKIGQVGTISSGDPEIGKLVADVIDAVGEEGLITVELSKGLETQKEVVEGFKIDRGYISAYMVTDAQRMEAVYEQPYILVTDRRISSIQEIVPLLEKVAKLGKKDMLIIADDVAGEALPMMVLNKMKGVFNVVAIKAPGYGENRTAQLEDIATLVGAKVVSEEAGTQFADVPLESLGQARKIVVGKDAATIVEGTGSPKEVEARIEALKLQIKEATSEYQTEQLQRRMASLAGKVAVIKVGGATEEEANEKKDRVDDAVAATRAAVAEGIVPGGGVTLVELAKLIEVNEEAVTGAQQVGALILKHALVQPFRELVRNAGLNPDEKLPQVQAAKPGMGFNVHDGKQLIDLKAAGVIDPTKVTREAIQNAVSIAGTAMTMGALIVNEPEQEVQA